MKCSGKYLLSCIFMCLPIFPISAQQNISLQKNDYTTILNQLENLAEQNSEDADYSSLLENLLYFREKPLDLNNATGDKLQLLHFLDDFQIRNLLNHISKNGDLLDIHELQSIDGFDLRTIESILPFVKISVRSELSPEKLKHVWKDGQHTIIYRYGRILEEQKGFMPTDSAALYDNADSRYIGSPDMMYLRYRFTYNRKISLGLTCEKDQGELFWHSRLSDNYRQYNYRVAQHHKSGFDFYSAHLFLSEIKFIKSLSIGDYQATFGQGLTLWNGHAFSKSADIMSPKKTGAGVRPYTSADENRFFRGIACTFSHKNIEASLLFSRKKTDGRFDTLSTGQLIITSLPQTGLHSTLSELEGRHSVTHTFYGANITLRRRSWTSGITAAQHYFDKKAEQEQYPYNKYESQDSIHTVVGFNYNFIFQNFNFYGEEAVNEQGGWACLNGVLLSVDPRLSISAVHRVYQKTFNNQFANSFGEGSGTNNEKGFYVGFVAKPANQIIVTGYFDSFKHEWLKYLVDAPSTGTDWMSQITYNPSKKFEVYFRIRSRNKEKNSSVDNEMDFISPYHQYNYRLHTSLQALPYLRLKSRIEFVEYQMESLKKECGVLLYQDLTFHKPGAALSVALRYTLFEADTYNARIYSYENDMPGGFSIPAFSDRGSRYYLLLDYVINQNIELWLRYSQTVYENKDVISESSLREINGNKKSEIKVQIRIKL